MAKEPGYCLHKSTGQAIVRFGGKMHYLGAYGTAESKERYNRLKAESMESKSWRASSDVSTGVLPRLMTYLGPRTDDDGFIGMI